MLSYKWDSHYCDLLTGRGLVEYDLTNPSYMISPRGAEALRLSEEPAAYLKPIEQMIEKYSSYNKAK